MSEGTPIGYVAQRKPSPIMKYFVYDHLKDHLLLVSAPICEIARMMDDSLPDSAEKSAGLRKLLEAKDCLVRAAMEVE